MIHNERVKLTASYVNTAAGSLFTAGVVAPVAASVFGLTTSGAGPSSLTLAVGIAMFLVASGTLHLVARRLLKELRS